MGNFFKDYFSFTRTESRIILILSVFLLLITIIRIHTDTLFPDKYEPSKEEIQEIEDFIASLEKINYEKKYQEQTENRVEEYYNNLMVFNPNKILVGDLKEMGFPENVISNLSKYRKAGGYFRKADDIKKIYGITETSFIKISPYILINDSLLNNSSEVKKSIRLEKININTADSIQLVSLNGIGPAFASRIIKYRKKLGGFINPDQLLEIYGLDSSIYALFKNSIYSDTLNIRKIDINNTTLSELEKHPYIDKFTAASVIKFRNFKGKISEIDDFVKYNIINEENLTKIKPYIEIKL